MQYFQNFLNTHELRQSREVNMVEPGGIGKSKFIQIPTPRVCCRRNKPFYQSIQRKKHPFNSSTALFHSIWKISSTYFKFHSASINLRTTILTTTSMVNRPVKIASPTRNIVSLVAEQVFISGLSNRQSSQSWRIRHKALNSKNRRSPKLIVANDMPAKTQLLGANPLEPLCPGQRRLPQGLSHCTHEFHGDNPQQFSGPQAWKIPSWTPVQDPEYCNSSPIHRTWNQQRQIQ